MKIRGDKTLVNIRSLIGRVSNLENRVKILENLADSFKEVKFEEDLSVSLPSGIKVHKEKGIIQDAPTLKEVRKKGKTQGKDKE